MYRGTSTCTYRSLLCSIIRHLPSLQAEAERFKLNVDQEDNKRLRESSAEPAEQGAGAAEMAEPRAASSNNNNDDGDEEKLRVPQPPVAAAQTNKQSGAGRQDILLLSDESHKSAVSAKSGSGSGGGGGIHRTRGEPSSSSSGTGSRYSSGDKHTMMTFDDLDKGHSPKTPPPVARGGGELEEEEPTDLSYEQWATRDQVRYNIIPNTCTCTCTCT